MKIIIDWVEDKDNEDEWAKLEFTKGDADIGDVSYFIQLALYKLEELRDKENVAKGERYDNLFEKFREAFLETPNNEKVRIHIAEED
jgi:hypothetical protein